MFSSSMRRNLLTIAAMVTLTIATAARADAEPTVDDIAPPLPVIVPVASGWQPMFPPPFDHTRASVTEADVNAEREMCQWYNAQYDTLMDQVHRFNDNLIRSNGDYNVANNQQIADALTANIDQSTAFLAPRAEALTQSRDNFGDVYYPIYQGESFYLLWQHLSNVSAGIRGRQPAWFVGPSVQRVMRWGTRINRSHVCRS
ncbi:hypothetical protein MycrhDRAFT_0948 [Mycolicibacterium rhodesiae JS60]|nr:hypothetical protein MycrhDRAFT_0948 [Mycolicibacterium rhodesiae JS60]